MKDFSGLKDYDNQQIKKIMVHNSEKLKDVMLEGKGILLSPRQILVGLQGFLLLSIRRLVFIQLF